MWCCFRFSVYIPCGLFTSIKTAGPISERARAASLVTGVPTAIGVIALIIASYCIH